MTWVMVTIYFSATIVIPMHTWTTQETCEVAAKIIETHSRNIRAFCVPKD